MKRDEESWEEIDEKIMRVKVRKWEKTNKKKIETRHKRREHDKRREEQKWDDKCCEDNKMRLGNKPS